MSEREWYLKNVRSMLEQASTEQVKNVYYMLLNMLPSGREVGAL